MAFAARGISQAKSASTPPLSVPAARGSGGAVDRGRLEGCLEDGRRAGSG